MDYLPEPGPRTCHICGKSLRRSSARGETSYVPIRRDGKYLRAHVKCYLAKLTPRNRTKMRAFLSKRDRGGYIV